MTVMEMEWDAELPEGVIFEIAPGNLDFTIAEILTGAEMLCAELECPVYVFGAMQVYYVTVSPQKPHPHAKLILICQP